MCTTHRNRTAHAPAIPEFPIFASQFTKIFRPELSAAGRVNTVTEVKNPVTVVEIRCIGIRDRSQCQVFDFRPERTVFPGEIIANAQKTFHKVISPIFGTETGSSVFQRLRIVTGNQRRVVTGNDDAFIESLDCQALCRQFGNIDPVFPGDFIVADDNHIFCFCSIFYIQNLRCDTGTFFHGFFDDLNGRFDTFLCPVFSAHTVFRIQIGNNGKIQFAVFDHFNRRM